MGATRRAVAVGAEGRGHRARRRSRVVRAAQVDGQLQRVAPGGGHEHHGRAEAPLVLHPVRGDPQLGEVDLRVGDHGVERGAERGEQVDGVGAAQAGGGADLDAHAPPITVADLLSDDRRAGGLRP